MVVYTLYSSELLNARGNTPRMWVKGRKPQAFAGAIRERSGLVKMPLFSAIKWKSEERDCASLQKGQKRKNNALQL